MVVDVVCLRPEEDFRKVGVQAPDTLSILYLSPQDDDLKSHLAEARALLIPAVGPFLPGDLFEGSRMELVQVTGAGVDRVDADTMKSLGIAVANVPGGSSAALAEYAVSSALVLLRRMLWASEELRNGRYIEARKRMVEKNLPGLEGLTVGVVGLGVIGLTVARAFHAMGSSIVYYDPAPRDPESTEALGARSMSLNQLLECADVVTLHVPLLPATEGMLGEQEFERMKSGAILINAARGGIVDEEALAKQLGSGKLGGAAVDVYSKEPPDDDNPLFLLEQKASGRLLLTPHIAGVTRQSWAFLFRSAWQNVERALVHGESPNNRVI